jgi:hypothetical protein
VRSVTDFYMLQIHCWILITVHQRDIAVLGIMSTILVIYLHADACQHQGSTCEKRFCRRYRRHFQASTHTNTACSTHKTRVYIIWRPHPPSMHSQRRITHALRMTGRHIHYLTRPVAPVCGQTSLPFTNPPLPSPTPPHPLASTAFERIIFSFERQNS